jgi:hypothetical protein
VPYGFIELNLSIENAALLPAEQRSALVDRVQKIENSPLCLEHWMELLGVVERFLLQGHE